MGLKPPVLYPSVPFHMLKDSNGEYLVDKLRKRCAYCGREVPADFNESCPGCAAHDFRFPEPEYHIEPQQVFINARKNGKTRWFEAHMKRLLGDADADPR